MSLRIPSATPTAGAAPGSAPADIHESADPGGPKHAPLTSLTGGSAAFAVEDTSLGGHKLLSGRAILVTVVVAAAGLLFAMRQLGMGSGLAFAEIKIDYPLEGADPNKEKDHEKILSDLQDRGIQPVPVEAIRMNPFEWKVRGEAEVALAQQVEVDAEELSRREREALNKQLDDEFAKLRLNSVIGGRIPVARISGELVKAGDKIAERFTVVSISGREVVLEAGGRTFSMSFGQEAPPR